MCVANTQQNPFFVYFKKIYPQVEEIRMANNIDNGKMSALDEFCVLMIESGLNDELTWTMESSVVRKEMRKPVYEKMRKAGCTFLTYGVETPAEHLLEKVGKTLALQKGVDLPAILREGKEAGIDLTINIMIGLPGETEEDFSKRMAISLENLIIKEEMLRRSKLLESVAKRIIDRVFEDNKSIKKAKVEISKMNPPIEGDVESVSIILKRKEL